MNLLLVIPCQGQIITVDDDGPADFNNIQAAIDDSSNGDIIEVKPGTYTGSSNRDIDFKGRAITVRSTDPDDPQIVNSTIVDCEGAGRGSLFRTGEGPESVIAGLTITNGYDSFIGGGIRCYNKSSPTVINCVITGNSARTFGGGIACEGSSNPTVSNCIIKDNSATFGFGGGVYCNAGSPMISNCLVIGNSALIGGGISCGVSNLTIRNCTFSGNTASNQGGGVYCSNSSAVTVENSILWVDTSNNGPEIVVSKSGGASSLTVSYCDVQGGKQAAVVEEDCTLDWGSGSINEDPLFVMGPSGNFCLSQIAAGQSQDSPCVDTGGDSATNVGLGEFSTRTDGVGDSGTVDMGYHYPLPEAVVIAATIDIKPETLNPASKARWIMCHIQLPEGYNVVDIDWARIVVQGSEIEAEGILADEAAQVAKAKFSRSEVQTKVGTGEAVVITVKGGLRDGTMFAGSDAIKVIHKGGKKE